MNFIDTHVHLYSKEYRNDLEQVLQNAQAQGVYKMFMPNVDSSSLGPMNEIAERHSTTCFPMIGLHPTHVKENVESELAMLKKALDAGTYIGVGEIGLDLYWEKTYWEQQQQAFLTQTHWAIEKNMPIAVHSRSATQEAIALLKPLVSPKLTGVFHCFVGTEEEAKTLLDMNFYLGIGGVSTFKNGGLDNVLPSVPLDRIVLETDAPYLAPVPFRGKRNESGYIPYIAKRVAEIYGISVEEVAKATTKNALTLFKIKE
jgi:TatD DNase family protein